MIRSEDLERFLLEFAIGLPHHEEHRPADVGSLWTEARARFGSCSLEEVLAALDNIDPKYARLTKYRDATLHLVDFETVRGSPGWQEFFTVGFFNIHLLSAGRRRLSELRDQVQQRPTPDDSRFARMAIEEARKSVSEPDGRPHPKVGAVVVKDCEVLSVAHRGEERGNHAEFLALEGKLADEAVAGATVYTTLEPCTTRNHPKIPCAHRLVERRVARVVVGMLDPDDRITGRGWRYLRKAGVVVDFFPSGLVPEVEELNRDFTRFCEQQSRELSGVVSEGASKPSKMDTILSYRGKVVTVMNRQRMGHQFVESYWPNDALVADCNQHWVVLEQRPGKEQSTFPLDRVQLGFDVARNRLRLEIER